MFNIVGEQIATERGLGERVSEPRQRGGSCISIDVEYISGDDIPGVHSSGASSPTRQVGCPLNSTAVQHTKPACDDVLSNSDCDEDYGPYRIKIHGTNEQLGDPRRGHGMVPRGSGARKEESRARAASRPPLGSVHVSRQSTHISDVCTGAISRGESYRHTQPAAPTWENYAQGSLPSAAPRRYNVAQVPGHKCEADNFEDDDGGSTRMGYSVQSVSNSVADYWSSDEEDGPEDEEPEISSVRNKGISAGRKRPAGDKEVTHKELGGAAELPVSSFGHNCHESCSPSSSTHCYSPYVCNGKAEGQDSTMAQVGLTGSKKQDRTCGDKFQVETSNQRGSRSPGMEARRAPRSPYRHHSEMDMIDTGGSGMPSSQEGRRLEDTHASSPAFLMASNNSILGTKDSIFGSMFDIVIPPSPLDTQDAQMLASADQPQTKARMGCMPIKYPNLNPLTWLLRRIRRQGGTRQLSDSSKQLVKTNTGGSEFAQMAAANARGRELYKRRHAVLLGRMEAILEESRIRRSLQMMRSRDTRGQPVLQGASAASGPGGLEPTGPQDLDTAFHAISAGTPKKGKSK